MNIGVPVEIGYEFWVPRARENYTTKFFVDEHQIEWNRDEITWEPYTRHKQIVRIVVTLTNGRVDFAFHAIDLRPSMIEGGRPMPQLYGIDEVMAFSTNEAAYEVAEVMAAKEIGRYVDYMRSLK